jgi:hypothetical protein
LKMTRDALALMELPRHHARILPGHGWRPPEEGWVKINTDVVSHLIQRWVEREELLGPK